MAEAFRGRPGGIQGLLTLPREQWEALEADLLALGFTVADVPGRVSWRALHLFRQHARPESAVFLVEYGEDAKWSHVAMLLADVGDAIRGLAYQGQVYRWIDCGEQGMPPERPRPTPRPGVDQALPDGEGTTHLGADPIPMDEFDDWWATGWMEDAAA